MIDAQLEPNLHAALRNSYLESEPLPTLILISNSPGTEGPGQIGSTADAHICCVHTVAYSDLNSYNVLSFLQNV
jgi:hypothetical protein